MDNEKMPEALRLADALESDYYDDVRVTAAAAELRRLYALVMDKQGDIYGLTFARETERKIHGLVKAECEALRAENDAYKQCIQANAVVCAAQTKDVLRLRRELSHLVCLLEPMERNGSLAVPGLATLNAARAALKEAE